MKIVTDILLDSAELETFERGGRPPFTSQNPYLSRIVQALNADDYR
jgi:hypothetical protein